MAAEIRFGEKHHALFSEASRDFSPFHFSEDYARSTPYGERVVYGVLGILACLRELTVPEGHTISAIHVEYRSPLLLGVAYQVVARRQSATEASMAIMDGSVTITRVRFVFGAATAKLLELGEMPTAERSTARHLDIEKIAIGTTFRGSYGPPRAAYLQLMEAFDLDRLRIGDALLITLLFSSYATGMELPGERGASASLTAEIATVGVSPPFEFELVYSRLDERFNMVGTTFRLVSDAGVLASGTIGSVARPARTVVNRPGDGSFPEQFQGKTALIIGASRGLGAAMALHLAAAGCRAIANFSRGAEDGCRLLERARGLPGEIVLEQGDASDQKWCHGLKARVAESYGTLDFLICNAAPAIQPMRLEGAFAERIAAYLARGFALAAIPLMTFLDHLSAAGGSVLLISSSAVEDPPATMPHFVAMKCAVEGFGRTAAAAHPKTEFWIARPGPLRTDLTNTVAGHDNAEAPDTAARRILADIGKKPRAAGVQYLK
jgi:NAD(P)-dependent dehydrogenase (short-subunit alcohol dehydrogenase family)